MRLKAVVTSLVIFGILLLAMWPWLLGNPPKKPAEPTSSKISRQYRDKQVRYLTKSAFYISTLLLTFFSATVCAWLLVRQARNEYLMNTSDNLKELIEGTLKDHEKRDG